MIQVLYRLQFLTLVQPLSQLASLPDNHRINLPRNLSTTLATSLLCNHLRHRLINQFEFLPNSQLVCQLFCPQHNQLFYLRRILHLFLVANPLDFQHRSLVSNLFDGLPHNQPVFLRVILRTVLQ